MRLGFIVSGLSCLHWKSKNYQVKIQKGAFPLSLPLTKKPIPRPERVVNLFSSCLLVRDYEKNPL
jgi:hypothetical protein